jgi:hypothetical protein
MPPPSPPMHRLACLWRNRHCLSRTSRSCQDYQGHTIALRYRILCFPSYHKLPGLDRYLRSWQPGLILFRAGQLRQRYQHRKSVWKRQLFHRQRLMPGLSRMLQPSSSHWKHLRSQCQALFHQQSKRFRRRSRQCHRRSRHCRHRSESQSGRFSLLPLLFRSNRSCRYHRHRPPGR